MRYPLYGGGVHPTFFPEQTLKDKLIDIVIRNEGEATLLEVVRAIEKEKDIGEIKGISFKDESGRIIHNPTRKFLDADKLPMPAWHLIDADKYAKKFPYLDADRVLPIHTSRGCPYKCAFCYNLLFNKRRWRAKTAEKAFEEIKFLVDNYGVDGIIVREDNFCTSKQRVINICRLIKNERLDISWYTSFRANYFTDDFLKPMADAGLRAVSIGAESGSPRILRLIDKDIGISDLIMSAKKAKNHQIIPIYSFVIGFPTETIEDINMTLDLIDQLKEIYSESNVVNINIYTPYPGSELYEVSKKHGFDEPQNLDEWGKFIWDVLNVPWVDNPRLLNTINQAGIWALNESAVKAVRGKNIIFNIGGYVLQKIARWRWKTNFGNSLSNLKHLIKSEKRLWGYQSIVKERAHSEICI